MNTFEEENNTIKLDCSYDAGEIEIISNDQNIIVFFKARSLNEQSMVYVVDLMKI